MKTVLITGCSSGYGLATARYFHDQGWNVIATMRTPRQDILPSSARLRVVTMDVTSSESIKAALATSGPIDVLVVQHKSSVDQNRNSAHPNAQRR